MSKEVIVCRCEEVDLEQIQQIASKYNCSPREIKLRTRAGMGYCGGRMCRVTVEVILGEITGNNRSDQSTLKVRPPVRPVTLSQLGESIYE